LDLEKFLERKLFLISSSFHPYFIWNFWSRGRHLFYRSKFGANLNPFEINLIRFENRIGRTVLPAPPVSAALTASPRCLAPHPAAEDRAPVASRPTCQAPRSTSPRLRPRASRPGRCHPTLSHGAVPTAPRAPSLPLSPAPPPRGAHPSDPLHAAPL
jgi:hypothetical protein